MSYDELTALIEQRDQYASEIESVERLDREIEKQDRPVVWAGAASEQSGTLSTGQTSGLAAPADLIEYVPRHVRRRYRRAPGVTCLHTTHTPGCGACRFAEAWDKRHPAAGEGSGCMTTHGGTHEQ